MLDVRIFRIIQKYEEYMVCMFSVSDDFGSGLNSNSGAKIGSQGNLVYSMLTV